MIFDTIDLADAEGAILAHAVRAGATAFKKGRRLSAADLEALRTAGVDRVLAARLEPGDVHEDEAATRCARVVAGAHLSASEAATGRVNLFADVPGLVVIDAQGLDRLNLVDEAITVATLPAFAPVEPGQMVATVKIIPFAAPAPALNALEAVAGADPPIVSIAPFRPRRIGLIQTRLAVTPEKILDKTARVTGDRVAALGCTLLAERRCPHETGDLAAAIGDVLGAGAEILLIAGASAITDRRDVLPAAVVAAGGAIEHFGMPVDPGNLLLLARIGDSATLGLPGCARSPKLNGFDWVLQRLVADVPVGRADIMRMGGGGLLTEIPSRPLPRAAATRSGEATAPRAPRIAALVLAAGQSRRMGGINKLLAPLDGIPMVARTVDAVLASAAAPVIVVTGHEREAVQVALAGRTVRIVDNPRFGEGLSTSLKAGLAALPETADGVLVCLGDMPRVTAGQIDRLIAAYAPAEGRSIIVPTRSGKRGNPVLWDRAFFAAMATVTGDVGARHLIGANEEAVAEVEMEDAAVLTDVDTPAALDALATAAATGR